jgi:hypothetical protein
VVLDVSHQEKIIWCDVWGSGWPLLKRQISVWERTSNPALWQMFIEEPPDLVMEMRQSPMLLQNEVVVVFLQLREEPLQ